MSVIIRLEPLSINLETLSVFSFGLSAQPMSFIFVQEDLQRSNTPALFALLAKFMHICQCGVRSDEQHPLTDRWTPCHLDDFSVLAFAFTFFLLHGTSGLFLDHPFDVVVMCPQFGSAEAGIYPLFVVGWEFRNDIDFGLADVTHILGSPTVMSLAWCNVARLDMYAWFCCHSCSVLLFAIDCFFASAVGFLGVQPISGDCKERVTLCSGCSGEKRPKWVIRAKP